MVIGNGMIAKAFESYRDKDDFIIFASGVSDSTGTDRAAFERETKLITETIKSNKNKLFVYFSTCSIYDASMINSPYVQHKVKMENLIKEYHSRFIIFRLTNPIGNTGNTNTVVNYFINHIIKKKEFVVWKNASRNIIDIDDMYFLCNEILQQKLFINTIVNIASPQNYPVTFIVETIEHYFNTRANYTLIDKAGAPQIDTAAVAPLFTKYNITFDEQYLYKLLKKYFPK
jgi:nucleoside-diphosphate-sugar epimerase